MYMMTGQSVPCNKYLVIQTKYASCLIHADMDTILSYHVWYCGCFHTKSLGDHLKGVETDQKLQLMQKHAIMRFFIE